MSLLWEDSAWEEYLYWDSQDKKTKKKINALIKDIQRNGPMKGIGKPEPLKYRPGYSRHIDNANRLIYDIVDGNIWIVGCKGHYDDNK